MTDTAASAQPSLIPEIEDFDDPTYDPFADAEAVFATDADPFSVMAGMRERGPVHEIEYRVALGQASGATTTPGAKCFMVVAYEEAMEAIKNTAVFSNTIFDQILGLSFGKTITAMDPPEHTRYRRIFQRAFSPNVVSRWTDTLVDPVVDDLLSKITGKGKADLIADFAQHYPFSVIYKLLELPQQDVKVFHKLAVAETNLHVDPKWAIEAGQKLGRYFEGMIAERRARPGDDLVTTLTKVEADGEKIPDDLIISFLRQLMNAGGDTTFRATSTLLGQLMLHPEQYAMLVADRSLMSRAIDEVLRWDTPVLMMYRVAIQDTELSGVKIPAGSLVQISQGAANRDPAQFPDPDRFDITRTGTGGALRFGAGPHICIGMHLARLEITRAMNALMDRLPNLRLDPSMPPPQQRGSELRSPPHVHVLFDS
ncbi:cytochrome P450 [Novosphingobium sp. PASSN1]|uniref:cytochrome P450 n=1 Tax=Novosphingobium sp. PASSN1 TaxID=2015561 RepID=UPI000BDDBA80|nr:cytochrome P450 [Novosphingobium sp. PASSN1]OYU34787.1 MAG: cytochrome [Novosphingobium sp. PASSN1]